MKKIVLFLMLAIMFTFTACVGNVKDKKDSADGVTLVRNGDNISIIAEDNYEGVEILLNHEINTDNLKVNSEISIVKKTENGILVVIAKKDGIKKGDNLFTINNTENNVNVKLTDSISEKILLSKNVKRNDTNILLGDYNNDNKVDLTDLNLLKSKYGSNDTNYDIAPAALGTGTWSGIYSQVSKDGKVNLFDFIVFTNNYGKSGPIAAKTLTKIEIVGSKNLEVKEGNNINVQAIATYSDNTTDSNVSWKVSKEGVVTYTATSNGVSVKGIQGDNSVVLTAYSGALEDNVTINVTKEVVIKNTINIYFHKDFATGIYAWVDANTKLFGAWPGKTITDKYSKNSDYYEVIVEGKDSILYLPIKNGDKVVADDQTATIGDVTWDANGNKSSGKPVSDTMVKITISPEKAKYKGTDTITISVSGGTISSKTAKIGSKDINFTGNTATIMVGDYVNDQGTATLTVTATNEDGPETKTLQIKRDDSEPVVVNDIDNLRIYQIMVCSFMDGDPSIGYDWQWAGYRANGDLQGVINSLDYIKGLGMNAIWMTPIFNTYSGQQAHNGYFANDYFNIDPHFGSNETFRRLVNEAHDKGIYVILDGVLGHNAGSNIAPSPISGKTPTTSNPVNYQDGGNTLQFYKDVVYYWIKEYKIDGWRFDQSYQLGPGNAGHQGQGAGNFYWDDIRIEIERAVAENKANGDTWGILGYQVGEDWEGEDGIVENTYGKGVQGIHSAFDFPTRYRIVQTLAREEYGKEVNDASNLNYDHSMYPSWAHPNLFIGNHDVARFGDLVNFSNKNNNYWERHKAAIAYLGAFTGPITMYYGEEWGSKTGNSDLKPMHVARNDGKISGFTSDEQDLINYTNKVMSTRSEYKALWGGKRTNLKAAGNQYIDLKEDGGQKIVFCLNIGTSDETFNVSVSGSKLTDLLTGQSFTGSGSFQVPMGKLQGRYLLVE